MVRPSIIAHLILTKIPGQSTTLTAKTQVKAIKGTGSNFRQTKSNLGIVLTVLVTIP